ncbi:MAG TPA: aldehyde dehydrogenase family protein [Gaiellaceae bacterium]|nr:aldehyde dehydrogenase family protein [Gaiellaceae bacterium]
MAVVAAHELEVVSPATLEVVARVPCTPPENLPALVAASRRAHARWRETPPSDRAVVLRAAAAALLERADEVADTVVAETGKPRVEAFTSELFPSLDALGWLARHAHRALAPQRVALRRPHLLHKRAWIRYDPLGVVGVISPWNFPFAIPFTQIAFALAAGNAVVLKPSELTPLSGALVADVFAAAGAPDGLVAVAQGGGDVGSALVGAGVDKVVFTGSAEAGRAVAAAAGERLVPVTLELGGNDAMVVLEDADLDRAVAGALWASFSNCGQVCAGVERILVESSLYEPFVEELGRRARGLRLGVDVGPLVSAEQRARVAALVEDAVERGGRVVCGGRAPERRGWWYEPTVLADVPPDARVELEETFGPVVTVRRVAGEDAAVAAANGVEQALGASVWTRDAERAARVGRRLRAGAVWHNDHAYSYAAAQAPWGGRGASGFGRTHSTHGLYELTSPTFVDRDRGNVTPPWWFPYDEGAATAFSAAARVLYAPRLAQRAAQAWRSRSELVELARRSVR